MADKELPKPKAVSFVICDTVIDDRVTGKKSLIGLFNCIGANKLPFCLPVINVYIGLTEGYGDYQCALHCVKEDDNKTIVRMQGPVKFDGPLAVVEANFEIRSITFPEAGMYRFEFLCEDIPVVLRKFQVIKKEKS